MSNETLEYCKENFSVLYCRAKKSQYLCTLKITGLLYSLQIGIRFFMSFFFPFPALKLLTVAKAMITNFALGKKKIKFLKFPNSYL